MKHLQEFKRNDASTQAGRQNGKYKNVFNVKFNDKDLEYYREKDMIDEKVFKRLMAKNMVEMSKLRAE